jgi:hypothetical protein
MFSCALSDFLDAGAAQRIDECFIDLAGTKPDAFAATGVVR